MLTLKKAAMVVLAGLAAAPALSTQVEARDGRNAAIVGGVVLGALAGAALANAGDEQGPSTVGWDDGGYGYRDYARPYAYRQVYRPRYVYVDPAPNYRTYYRRPYREDWRWHHPHRWQHWGQGESDGRGGDRQDY